MRMLKALVLLPMIAPAVQAQPPSPAPQPPPPLVRENATVKVSNHVYAIPDRVSELKAQGRSADETAQTVAAEIQAKFPDWTAPMRIGAAARAAYGEEK